MTNTNDSITLPVSKIASKLFAQCGGKPPYASSYIGTYFPLAGWASRTSESWVTKQVGGALRLIELQILQDLTIGGGPPIGGGPIPGGDPAPDPIVAPDFLESGEFSWLSGAVPPGKQEEITELMRTAAAEGVTYEQLNRLLSGTGVVEVQPSSGEGGWVASATRAISGLLRREPRMRVPDITTPADLNTRAGQELLAAMEKVKFPTEFVAQGFNPYKDRYAHLMWWPQRVLTLKREENFILSPVGLLDLYRHYFYDFGTFLGPPEAHIWIAPYSTTEFFELTSQTDYRFRESETSTEILEAEEETLTEKTDLATEMARESSQDIKVGVSAKGGIKTEVYQVSASASFDYGSHTARSSREVRNTSRELSSKVTSEMKRSTRLLTRVSTETKRTNSRRQLIENTTADIINYEMRRKMQRVGVEIQHLGTQLCWQLYVDAPGDDLGLAELVHIAKPEDFNTAPPPDDAPPSFDQLEEEFQFIIPFDPIYDKENDNHDYIEGVHHSGDQNNKIVWQWTHTIPVPQPGYVLVDARVGTKQGTNPSHNQPSRWSVDIDVVQGGDNQIRVKLLEANFEKQHTVLQTVRAIWDVKETVRNAAETEYAESMTDYHQAQQRAAHETMVAALRERIDLARSVIPRPSDDLREEERAVLYRRALSLLIDPDDFLGDDIASKIHTASELVRTYFEVDKMLYFVASDWWNPRMDRQRGGITIPTVEETTYETVTVEFSAGTSGPITKVVRVPITADNRAQGGVITKQVIVVHEGVKYNVTASVDLGPGGGGPSRPLGQSSRVRFGREHGNRPDKNYLITDESEPVAFGSSIGWLLQLDGDKLRNAYLNAAWAKVVIPIRRGKEKLAFEWLKQQEVEGNKGFADEYVNEAGEKVPKMNDEGNPILDANGDPVNKTIEDVLEELIETLTARNNENQEYLANQTLYEHGFDPLAGGIDLSEKERLPIVDRRIEIVPTGQLVPIKYKEPTVTVCSDLWPPVSDDEADSDAVVDETDNDESEADDSEAGHGDGS